MSAKVAGLCAGLNWRYSASAGDIGAKARKPRCACYLLFAQRDLYERVRSSIRPNRDIISPALPQLRTLRICPYASMNRTVLKQLGNHPKRNKALVCAFGPERLLRCNDSPPRNN